MRKGIFSGLILLFLVACGNPDGTLVGVQLRLVTYAGIRPSTVALGSVPQGSAEPSAKARATLSYALSPDDSLWINIEEYADPVVAYASWLNRGLGPERMPRIIGQVVEQSIWSGRWIFLFRSSPHRLPEQGAMDSLVGSFPETGGTLPAAFLTLPLRARSPSGASVQKGVFLGVNLPNSMLCQRYQDQVGPWSAARSLKALDESDFAGFYQELALQGTKPATSGDEWTEFIQGRTRVIVGRVDGILLAVWGRRDQTTLVSLWKEARRTIKTE
jgi:hypothetical protein